jgi:hypothetical protein
MDAWLGEMKAVQERTDANLREMKVEIRANNEKFEVIQGAFVFWMDRRQSGKGGGQDECQD